MKKLIFTGLVLWCTSYTPAGADELRILPGDVVLNGPTASQQLLLLQESDGQYRGDLTNEATFTSSNPRVAVMESKSTIRAVSDGETQVTAVQGDHRVTIAVKVANAGKPFAWSFRNHVIPAMTKIGCNSGACHGALAGKGGFKLSLRGYDPQTDQFVMTRQSLGRRVDKLEPARSLVLLKPSMAIAHGGGQKLEVNSQDYRVISEWIAAGAPAPRENDVRIKRLELFPQEAVLKPRDKLQVLVRAWYADGHAEDVTRWSKFNSSEDLVATVDQDGKVRVVGNGEAAITVWFSNLVASSRIVSPLPQAVDPSLFAKAARNNFIDNLVLKKLQSLRIPPSPLCSDADFIRRVYLDGAGILPTPHEVLQFVKDSAADKRAKLIDAVLERSEFVDYWAYKWSDLLLVSSRKLPMPAVWSFYQFIRESVADNKPWDQFAREILTATGSTLKNGATNYFALHKDVADLTESTAVTFLGTSLTCARCHNHPLEKWTQDQYWEMASLFSRVALKNGEAPGEVSVQPQPTGEILHPRRNMAMLPTPLDGKPLPAENPSDRRRYFADWLTGADNPYFARALVNRLWKNFMGRGLVEPEDDLRQTNPATNEELFETLARHFVGTKYNVKQLARLILNSATYQRSSKPLPENSSDDRFYSHYLIRRLPAEVILGAYAEVTDVATPFPGYPAGTRPLQLPDALVASPFLDAFGRPERSQTCSCERQQDSSVSQALHVNNGGTLNDKLRAPNSRLAQWVRDKLSDEEVIQRLFLLALSRQPTTAEAQKFKNLMADASRDAQTSRQHTLEDLFWAVLSGREFLFNH